MDELEDKLNNLLREKIEKYEDELKTIRSDYEKNQEKIKQDLYQIFSDKQDEIIEIKKKKKTNKTLQKLFHNTKKFIIIVKIYLINKIK